jgi:hypothetical protein
MTAGYQPPSVRDLGTLVKMTEQTFNKVGTSPDVFTTITNGIVIGSLQNSP